MVFLKKPRAAAKYRILQGVYYDCGNGGAGCDDCVGCYYSVNFGGCEYIWLCRREGWEVGKTVCE